MRWAVFVLVLLFLTSCAQTRPANPGTAIDDMKAACENACTGTQTVNVTVPVGWSLVSDPDGLCLKKSTRILCGTCDCDTYGLLAGELIAASDTERSVVCSFTGDADALTLTAQCS